MSVHVVTAAPPLITTMLTWLCPPAHTPPDPLPPPILPRRGGHHRGYHGPVVTTSLPWLIITSWGWHSLHNFVNNLGLYVCYGQCYEQNLTLLGHVRRSHENNL